jgi:hypothetical protein
MGTSYLSQVSIFHSATALALILSANVACTLLHLWQEWKGEVPLWRVFGAIGGLCVPHAIGFAVFTAGLGAALLLAALIAFVGVLGVTAGAAALGFLIGARIADSVVSHWRLYAIGYRPNPGLSSTVLYVFEAAYLLWAFWKGLSAHPFAAAGGFVLGAGTFILVLPALRAIRARVTLAYRREPWLPGEPLPAWTRDANCTG